VEAASRVRLSLSTQETNIIQQYFMENIKPESEIDLSNVEFPDVLNETDVNLIVRQCELQNATSKEEIEGFAQAYKELKEFSDDEGKLSVMSVEDFLEYIQALAEKIDKVNVSGYSKVPRMFGPDPTNKGVDAENIQRAMEGWAEAYIEGRMEPDEAYEMFERVHPYDDGNGRLGDILWKFAVKRNTGTWPYELPPDVFNKKDEGT
jgi:hypothetical protein